MIEISQKNHTRTKNYAQRAWKKDADKERKEAQENAEGCGGSREEVINRLLHQA